MDGKVVENNKMFKREKDKKKKKIKEMEYYKGIIEVEEKKWDDI